MTHEEIRHRHREQLHGYRDSQEYAAYARAAGWPAPEGELPALIGRRWEIDAETYAEFLEVLPPLAHRGGSFFLSEFVFGDITTKYTKQGDRYYCEFARYPERSEAPSHTPWGHPDTVTELAPGIVSYSTPSHGGIWLSPDRVAEMPRPLRDFPPFTRESGHGRWYEEDCDWSIVALAFPQYFSEEAVAAARATLKASKPHVYEALLADRAGTNVAASRGRAV